MVSGDRVHKMEGLEEQYCSKPFTDTNNNSSTNSSSKNSLAEEKYALRPRTIIKRLQQERIRQDPKRPVKSKSRPAPLSKYRRKTANARERHRMREINNAFESLRKVLPDVAEVQANSSTFTKIMTLRLAVEYIRALSDVLEDDSDVELSSIETSLHNSIQNSLQNCMQQALPQSCQHHHSQKTVSTLRTPTTIQYVPLVAPVSHQYTPQLPQLLGHCSLPEPMSASSSPSTVRGSVSSTSDLEELFSDDSGLLEDNLDVFHDIPTLTVSDPFEILLGAEKDALPFTTELCN